MATDFPILEEIKNVIYYNLETIFLIVVPLATLIGWISGRIGRRLQDIKELNIKEICALENRIEKIENKINDLEISLKVDISIIKGRLEGSKKGDREVSY